jgi:hypothetical protein
MAKEKDSINNREANTRVLLNLSEAIPERMVPGINPSPNEEKAPPAILKEMPSLIRYVTMKVMKAPRVIACRK